MVKEVHLFSLKSLFWDIKIHVEFHSTFHWQIGCFEFRTEIPVYKICQCPKINSLPILSYLISMQHYNVSKSGGDFSAKSKWLHLLHTGIACRNFFHFTIIPPWRVSWVSRELDKLNYNLFVWSTVFQPKWNDIKKTYKNYQNPAKSYCFLGYYQSLFNFG